jgi:hypothetical protein
MGIVNERRAFGLAELRDILEVHNKSLTESIQVSSVTMRYMK